MAQSRKKLSPMRKYIGNALSESVSAHPQARSYVLTDMTELLKLKDELKAGGKSASFTGLFVKAVVEALRLHPHNS